MLFSLVLVAASLGLLAGAGTASASQAGHRAFICSGTPKSPGVLAGNYRNVVVRGICEVNAGQANVHGNLIIARRGVLLAAFALNDQRHSGRSSLSVARNLVVRRGGALLLGCEAAHFACIDDPHPKKPTLNSSSSVGGNLISLGALGVVVHNSTIGANVLQRGGGGGATCTPSGIFAAFKSPVYSDYEDNWIGGSLAIAGLRSCWLGALRNNVRGSVAVLGNKMNDPDAMEINSNRIHHSIVCFANSPAVQFGDGHGTPNRVRRFAAGECGFGVRKPNPAPHGPLTPISVRWRH